MTAWIWKRNVFFENKMSSKIKQDMNQKGAGKPPVQYCHPLVDKWIKLVNQCAQFLIWAHFCKNMGTFLTKYVSCTGENTGKILSEWWDSWTWITMSLTGLYCPTWLLQTRLSKEATFSQYDSTYLARFNMLGWLKSEIALKINPSTALSGSFI